MKMLTAEEVKATYQVENLPVMSKLQSLFEQINKEYKEGLLEKEKAEKETKEIKENIATLHTELQKLGLSSSEKKNLLNKRTALNEKIEKLKYFTEIDLVGTKNKQLYELKTLLEEARNEKLKKEIMISKQIKDYKDRIKQLETTHFKYCFIEYPLQSYSNETVKIGAMEQAAKEEQRKEKERENFERIKAEAKKEEGEEKQLSFLEKLTGKRNK